MELKEAFIKSVSEVSSLYNIQSRYKEDRGGNVIATDQVSVMISFAQSSKGKVIFGFSRDRALKIASAMLGQEVNSLDSKAQNAVSEFVTFITSLAVGKMEVIGSAYFSAPVLVAGNNVFLVVNRQKVSQLVFDVDDDAMLLTYCIE